MKKKHEILIGFAVLLLAAIVTFAGCPTDPSDEGPHNGNLGTTLTISGEQVYTRTWSNNGQASYTALSGDKTVKVSGGNSGLNRQNGNQGC
jgi:hypothetical protein